MDGILQLASWKGYITYQLVQDSDCCLCQLCRQCVYGFALSKLKASTEHQLLCSNCSNLSNEHGAISEKKTLIFLDARALVRHDGQPPRNFGTWADTAAISRAADTHRGRIPQWAAQLTAHIPRTSSGRRQPKLCKRMKTLTTHGSKA